MATRRNRIKAVINVPRGRPGGTGSSGLERPLTPLTCNLSEPSSPAGGLPKPDRVASPSLHLPPSSSLLRSPSPLKSSYDYPTLTLVKSPGPSDRIPWSPGGGERRSYTPYPSSPSPDFNLKSPGSQEVGLRSPPAYADFNLRSPMSPAVASPRSYSNPNSVGPIAVQRPSPSPSPSSDRQLAIFSLNTNSNSADSHEVARYMSSVASPSTPSMLERSPSKPSTPGPGFHGAFRDYASSIVPGSSDMIKQRLQKPCPALTVSKYQTARKEFLNKCSANSGTAPERNKLTMLHFTFWNPPSEKKDKGSRSRASSVCSDKGPQGKSFSDHDVDSRQSLLLDEESGSITARRATIETSTMLPSKKGEEEEEESQHSDAESTASSSQKSIGPRVKVGPDGQLIIDEQSLVIETSESQRAKKQLSEMETVSGADFVVGSSGLFRNKRNFRRGTDWSVKETVKFYKALTMCGTDFSMMATLFPTRTRAELKSKFKREDRRNPGQISSALTCQEFDPGEGITSDEDDEHPPTPSSVADSEEPDFYIGEKSPSSKKRRASSPVSRPSSSASGKGANVPLKKGRPTASWKSNQVTKTKKGDLLTISKIKKESNTAMAMAKINNMINKDALKSPTKAALKEGTKTQDTLRTTTGDNTQINEGTRVNETKDPCKNCIEEILRFDASDPLGLKIVPVQASDPNVEPPSSEDIVTLTPVVSSTNSQSCSRNSEDNTVEEMDVISVSTEEFLELENTIKRLPKQAQMKVLPYRVPGPGGGPPVSSSPSLVDEIEIEISCQ